MTPGEVDEALKQYQELSEKQQRGETGETTDRGMLGDMILNFRLPSIMEFLTLMGSNRMHYVPVAPGPAPPMYPPPPMYSPYGYPVYPGAKYKAKEDPSSATEQS
ncbi:uncharacterized protein ACA1_344360 [Acanthamoeba castellanii str. Neff]|uniref:Uncharacterized protein n=1 Tax=Acanthamoeba castellanii (strain ATCC 30010 / Neff) TaxID=1257118 RepID=L8GDZ2_ACACF|nr:uncharacterized protein ACA1_344360 [Acanthamoeba castellanii str. Neff]ELR11064.1 hypothetical protein ACA1_344360 [Acanthamoeba castellanii str. Neff]